MAITIPHSIVDDFFGTGYLMMGPQSQGPIRTVSGQGVQQMAPAAFSNPLQAQNSGGQRGRTKRQVVYDKAQARSGGSASLPEGYFGGASPDLYGLRSALGDWLTQNFAGTPPAYGGQLTIDSLRGWDEGDAWMREGVNQGASYMRDAISTIQGLIGKGDQITEDVLPYFRDAYSQAKSGAAEGLEWLRMGREDLQELMRTGGAPNITAALNAIEAQSRGRLEDVMAQIREEYSQAGFGRSGDLNEALTRGGGRVIADMNAAMTQLQAQILNEAANRRLGAVGLAPQYATAAGNITRDASAAMTGAASGMLSAWMQPYGVQAQLANVLPSAAKGLADIYGMGANYMQQSAALDLQRQTGNIERQYQEHVRTTTPNILPYAIQYATSFPPQMPTMETGPNPLWSALGQLGSQALGSILGGEGLAKLFGAGAGAAGAAGAASGGSAAAGGTGAAASSAAAGLTGAAAGTLSGIPVMAPGTGLPWMAPSAALSAPGVGGSTGATAAGSGAGLGSAAAAALPWVVGAAAPFALGRLLNPGASGFVDSSVPTPEEQIAWLESYFGPNWQMIVGDMGLV